MEEFINNIYFIDEKKMVHKYTDVKDNDMFNNVLFIKNNKHFLIQKIENTEINEIYGIKSHKLSLCDYYEYNNEISFLSNMLGWNIFIDTLLISTDFFIKTDSRQDWYKNAMVIPCGVYIYFENQIEIPLYNITEIDKALGIIVVDKNERFFIDKDNSKINVSWKQAFKYAIEKKINNKRMTLPSINQCESIKCYLNDINKGLSLIEGNIITDDFWSSAKSNIKNRYFEFDVHTSKFNVSHENYSNNAVIISSNFDEVHNVDDEVYNNEDYVYITDYFNNRIAIPYSTFLEKKSILNQNKILDEHLAESKKVLDILKDKPVNKSLPSVMDDVELFQTLKIDEIHKILDER